MKPPFVTREQISELDALMVERFNIPINQMMEMAGLRLAEFIREKFPEAHHVLFFIGKGNNGGDGLQAARYLLEYSFAPAIVVLTENLGIIPSHHLEAAMSEGIPVYSLEDYRERVMINQYDIVVDCLLGYGLNGPPRGDVERAIDSINDATEEDIPIVACDIPSGVDCDRGPIYEPRVEASHILSFGLPRIGCKGLQAQLYVANIDVPKELYPMIKVEAEDYFSEHNIILI